MKKEEKELAVIESNIFVFRDKQVMVDRDLARLYDVETKRIKINSIKTLVFLV